MNQNKVLENITYEVLENDSDVRAYILKVADEEWDPRDFEIYGEDLRLSEWVLEEVEVKEITFGPSMPDMDELSPRIEKIVSLIKEERAIPPLILRGRDFLIFDGYARTHAFRKLGISTCLAYVGSQ